VFFELLAETKKYPSTSQITRRSGLKNKTYVMDLMMRLVGWGYIGSYVKGNKRVWCDRAEAERLKYITEKRDAKI